MERAFKEEFGQARRAGSALDIGCGTGRWTRWMGRWWTRPIGVDLSRAMLLAGARRQRAQGDITRLPFATAAFDCAVSVTVIQHLPPDAQQAALAEAARVLRPGATLVLLEMTRDVAPRAHVFPRSVDGWRDALDRSGIDVESVRGSTYVPLIRAGASVVSNVRRPGREPATEIDLVKLGGQPGEATSASIAALPGPALLAARALVAASYPAERIASLAPPAMATHACIVARRR